MGTEVESKEMEVGLLRAVAESDAMATASTTRESFSPDFEDEDAMEDVAFEGAPAMEVAADEVPGMGSVTPCVWSCDKRWDCGRL
jgi:hypothetical protein